jgi:hypothetical protein
MAKIFRPVSLQRRPPDPDGYKSQGTTMAQQLKGSAFNILFTASFFASFAYFMLHFG